MFGLSLVQLALLVILLAGLVAIVVIALRAMGVNPPPWAVQMFWVCVIVLCACLAILLIAYLVVGAGRVG